MALTVGKSAADRAGDGSAAFDALLRGLHPDRDSAAEKYEEIRQLLCRFFYWRRARWPDELADETIDRVGRRLATGEVIRAVDVKHYFLGVARNVLRESWRREQQRERGPDMDALPELVAPPARGGGNEDARFVCLERCLAELGADRQDLVLRYYQGAGGTKMENRRALAAQLGVSPATLRIRMHRLRARLEVCVRKCLGAQETSGAPAPPTDEDGHE